MYSTTNGTIMAIGDSIMNTTTWLAHSHNDKLGILDVRIVIIVAHAICLVLSVIGTIANCSTANYADLWLPIVPIFLFGSGIYGAIRENYWMVGIGLVGILFIISLWIWCVGRAVASANWSFLRASPGLGNTCFVIAVSAVYLALLALIGGICYVHAFYIGTKTGLDPRILYCFVLFLVATNRLGLR